MGRAEGEGRGGTFSRFVLLWERFMHLPDGFLSTPIWAGMAAVSAPSVGYLARRAQAGLEESRVPLLGVMGAFVFAAQMINFPVGPGTTGHLMGAALLAYTLGPSSASVVMTAILAIQALVFQDGGVLALGANVFNMSIAGVAAAYLPCRLWGSGGRRSLAVFFGAALSVLTTAALALVELRVSGVTMPGPVAGLAIGLFAVNAVLEGGLTLAVIRALERMEPGWVRMPSAGGYRALSAAGLVACLLAVVGVLAVASDPDTLEKLAGNLGIASRAKVVFGTPFADYETGFLSGSWLRRSSAGVLGLALVFGASILAGKVLARRRGS